MPPHALDVLDQHPTRQTSWTAVEGGLLVKPPC
jgi:hypothetical protein